MLKENTPSRLVYTTKSTRFAIVSIFAAIVFLLAYFVADYSLRLTLHKPIDDLTTASDPEPMLSIARCPQAHFGWLRAILPDQCDRTFVRLRDIDQAEVVVDIEEDQESGDLTYHYHLEINLIPLASQRPPRNSTLQWLQARGLHLQRTSFRYSSHQSTVSDDVTKIRSLVNDAVLKYRRNPTAAIVLDYEETHLLPLFLVVGSLVAFALSAWFMATSEDLVFDVRHSKLYIHKIYVYGARSSTQVIPLEDIRTIEAFTERSSEDDSTQHGVRLAYVEHLPAAQDPELPKDEEEEAPDDPADDEHKAQPSIRHFAGSAASEDIVAALNEARSANAQNRPDGLGMLTDRYQQKDLFLGRTWRSPLVVAETIRVIQTWLAQAAQQSALTRPVNNQAPRSDNNASVPNEASSSRSGASTPPPTSSASAANSNPNPNPRHCVICLDPDTPPTVLFLPCRHINCCAACCAVLTECPLCRKSIREKITVRT